MNSWSISLYFTVLINILSLSESVLQHFLVQALLLLFQASKSTTQNLNYNLESFIYPIKFSPFTKVNICDHKNASIIFSPNTFWFFINKKKHPTVKIQTTNQNLTKKECFSMDNPTRKLLG